MPGVEQLTMVVEMNVLKRDSRLPEGAVSPRLIVCEQTGRWAVALGRELPESLRAHETRSVPACWEMLAEGPAGFVVIELTAGNVDAVLSRMARFERDFPLARVAVVAARSMASYRWLLREAGAVDFVTSPRRLAALADAACRHLDQAPRGPQSQTERIWAKLPWAASGSGSGKW
jgi:DNA-binding response OmpR family regulator